MRHIKYILLTLKRDIKNNNEKFIHICVVVVCLFNRTLPDKYCASDYGNKEAIYKTNFRIVLSPLVMHCALILTVS